MLMFWKVHRPTNIFAKTFHCYFINKQNPIIMAILVILAFILLVGWATLGNPFKPTKYPRTQKFHGTDSDWHDIVNDL